MNDRKQSSHEDANPIDVAQKILAEGKHAKAAQHVVDACDASPDDINLQMNAAIFLFNQQRLDADTYKITERAILGGPSSSDFWRMLAHISFSLDFGNIHETRGREAAIRAIRLDEGNIAAYRILIYIYLLQQRFGEAYMATLAMALQTGKDNPEVSYFIELLKYMMAPTPVPVQFMFDGELMIYTFDTTTPSSLTTALRHVGGQICEAEELEFVKEFVGSADKILEVGTLVGNHTAYFLRCLCPTRYLAIDGHPRCVEITRKVAELNKRVGFPCDIDVLNYWIGADSGTAEMFGQEIPIRALDEIANEQWDFIKIDVDGSEIDLVNGAEKIFTNGSPKVMIETENGTDAYILTWLGERGYRIVNTISHGHYQNHFAQKL